MTREEAIRWLTNEKWKNANNKYKKEWNEAFDLAIEALMHEIRTETHGVCLISRADAIAYIDRVINSGLGRNKSLDYIRKYISALPSAEIPTESTNTPTNTPTDLISRADAIEAVRLETSKLGRGLLGKGDILDIIEALPSAEAVQGEWVGSYECSVCGKQAFDFIVGYIDGVDYLPNFCPNCGARMEANE